ncbi:hypothetical protein, partial [Marinobacter alexandrii]|uniref:hypothetical protein n=1 Tax=Marinobacter alexandrii TaxID=2570351 RepID=UPI0032997D00
QVRILPRRPLSRFSRLFGSITPLPAFILPPFEPLFIFAQTPLLSTPHNWSEEQQNSCVKHRLE